MTAGFPVRLRCGAGQRLRLRLMCKRETDVEPRKARMEAVAATLVRAGQLVEVPIVLQALADQVAEADFARYEKRAYEVAAEAAEQGAPPPRVQTFGDVAQQWTSGQLRRLNRNVGELQPKTASKARTRLAHLGRTLGKLPLAQITKAECDRALAALPEMKDSTFSQYAALVRRVLNLAVMCSLLDASPLPREWVPGPGPRRARSFLYPDEDAQLCACVDVPLDHRLLWGFLSREGLRIEEALRLAWSDLDLARGAIRLDKNKTNRPRHWKLDAGSVRALSSWRRMQGEPTASARVFVQVSLSNAAAILRAHVKLAGIERAELFVHDDQRMNLGCHDLRGTFVTLSLAAGRTEQWVMERTGHTESSKVQLYKREADFARELAYDQWLTPLDEAVGLEEDTDAGMQQAPSPAHVDDLPRRDRHAPGGLPGAALLRIHRGRRARPGSVGPSDARGGAGVVAPVSGRDAPGPTGRAADRRNLALEGGPGVGQGDASHGKLAALGGLPQTPGHVQAVPVGPKTRGKRSPSVPGKLAGPPGFGGVGQRDVDQAGAKDGAEGAEADMSESVVEDALARAIDRASSRGEWDVVVRLASELGERRRARTAPSVASLETARRRRAGSAG